MASGQERQDDGTAMEKSGEFGKTESKVDENGKVWYPDAGALKASVLMTGQNNGQKEITDEEWTYMKSWLRPVMLSIVKSKRILLEGVTFKNSPGWCIHPLSCEKRGY